VGEPVVTFRFLVLVFFAFFGIAVPREVQASQAQDWYIGPAEEGSSSEVTVFFPGVLATLDHRVDVFSGNQLLLQTGGIVTYPFGNLFVATDLRFLLFSIGGKIGFHELYVRFGQSGVPEGIVGASYKFQFIFHLKAPDK